MLLGKEVAAVAAAVQGMSKVFLGRQTTNLSTGLAPRADTSCPASYTSQNGLNFTSICGFDVPCPANSTNCDLTVGDNNAAYYNGITTFQACQELCSTRNFFGRCYGVAYDVTRARCWLKGSLVTADLAQKNTVYTFNTALANRDQLDTPSNTNCPYNNNSTISTSDGMDFQLFCSSDLPGYDIGTNIVARPHANTIDECIADCASTHGALCDAVAWNVGLENGYPNCFLKTQVNYTVKPQSAQSTVEIHFARLLPSVITRVNISVPADSTYSTNGSKYGIQQNTLRAGATTLSSVHADNITACLDSCAANSTCQAVSLDLAMKNGYQNCYLLSNNGTSSSSDYYIFAQKTGTAPVDSSSGGGSSTSSATSSSSSSGGSKAWIAGAVIGPLALIAIIVAAVLLWRRRQRRKYQGVAQNAAAHPVDEKKPYNTQPYNTGEVYAHEMPDSANIYEMPDGRQSMMKPLPQGPQELTGSQTASELPGHVKR